MVPTSVKLPPETAEKLDRLAQMTGRSKAYYLREAITEHIDRMLWEQSILTDLADVRAGRQQTWTIDEVEAELGLAD